MEHSGYKLYAELFTNCQITSKPMSEGIKEDFWVTSLACSMGRASSYTTGIFFSRTFMGAPTGGGAIPEHDCTPPAGSSSSSIGTATLMGFGLLNYRWVFSTGRFYRVPLPAARQTSNLEDQWLERSNSRHQVPPPRLKRRERTPAAEGGTIGEKLPRILSKVASSTSLWVLLHA